jgi:hypothetical protein
MPDQPVAPIRPVLARDQLHQIALDLFRILMFGQAQPLRQSDNVRVYNDAFIFSECVAQHDIRRFSTYSGKFAKFLHG